MACSRDAHLALPGLAKFYFFKDVLKVEPATATLVGGLTSLLPWSIKPLYGLLTDAVPICGYRRKPYVIIGGVAMALCWFGMAMFTTELWHAVIFLSLGNIAAATVNVCAEAVTVECSAGRSFGRAATLQSWQWGANMLASIIGSIIGGYLLDAIGQKPLFMATGDY
jgi:MFS family permease